MKIENTSSVQMLHKGVVETAQKNMKSQETERLKAASESSKNTTYTIENKGVHFDAKV